VAILALYNSFSHPRTLQRFEGKNTRSPPCGTYISLLIFYDRSRGKANNIQEMPDRPPDDMGRVHTFRLGKPAALNANGMRTEGIEDGVPLSRESVTV